ncbi:lipid-A-disaccharide synthase [mine drainage metagenome]|uniref:lipid-A-disaccharide synthase n=1 Tax=mine drainage metagenome TaxID=410659 RepID=T0YFU6_9ZZZZ
MPRIAFSIGELSGDILAADVLGHLRDLHSDLKCLGVTGPALRGCGCESILPVEALSVSGLTEAIAHLPRLWHLRRQLTRTILDWKPDLFLGVDAPDFNLGLERTLRQHGIRVAHLVSPSVWAWRPKRVQKVAAATDTLFCLFPFEPDYYRATRVRRLFVGHPLADRLQPLDEIQSERQALGLDPHRTTVALLPGSRLHELENLGSVMMQAARLVQQDFGPIQFILPVAQDGFRPVLEALWRQYGPNQSLLLLDRDGPRALSVADAAWVASGTATLEGLLVGCPMVVAYRVSGVTAWIARNVLGFHVRWVSIPNLLAREFLVPECLQEQVRPKILAEALLALLQHPDRRNMIRARFQILSAELRHNFGVTVAAELGRMLVADSGQGNGS